MRIGNETLRLLAMLRAFLSASPLKKEDDVFHRRPFMPADVHLPMSSALGVCNHASDTGHAEGVPIAPSRGRSVSFPILRELWLHM